MEVGKDTKFSLTIETAISILVSVGMVIGMWFTLQADIEEAKELPVPEVGRTEYDLKDQMIRNTIIETQKDVTEMKEEQKEMRDDVKNIERMMMQQN
jgi:plasmid maintenance system antidote protein VapI|tara:strand:- start:19311 stop:19601 length:291 start_codon:yes stop_codon:yes gene_type:complete